MRYVDVYPIKRLPRRFGAFTYAVTDDMNSSLARGSFVSIPWRKSEARGIVSSLHDNKPGTEAKPLLEVLEQHMTETDLTTYENLAKQTFQSVSSILDSAFPKPRKRKARIKLASDSEAIFVKTAALRSQTSSASISNQELERLKNIVSTGHLISFVQVSDLVDTTILTHLLSKQHGKPILLLLPHQHDVDIAQEILSRWTRTRVCTSNLTEAQRFDLAEAWRSGEIPLLISTRLGALFLPPENLGAIVVGRSGIQEHAQYDRNPRYDSRILAHAWSKNRSCPLILTDTLPRPWDLTLSPVVFARNNETKQSLETAASLHSSQRQGQIINLKERIRFGDDPLLTEPLIEQIDTALENKKRVLLLCNQKGIAGKLKCKNCDFVETCGTCERPLAVYETHLLCAPCKRATKRPAACRKCRKNELRTVRRGTGALTKLVKERWPEHRTCIIEKDGEIPGPQTDILIATSFYYEQYYRPHVDNFGLVSLICADQEIRLENHLTAAARRFAEYAGIAKRSKAPFLVQTWDPALTQHIDQNGFSLLDKELQARRNLGQPPFVQELELLARGKEGLQQLDRALRFVRQEPQTTLNKITPGRWKILSNSAKLLQTLSEMDDSLVISNKTSL